MIDVGRIISYLTISLILLFGIAVVSGVFFDFEWKMRLTIGALVGLYVMVRLYFLMRKSKPESMIKYRDDTLE